MSLNQNLHSLFFFLFSRENCEKERVGCNRKLKRAFNAGSALFINFPFYVFTLLVAKSRCEVVRDFFYALRVKIGNVKLILVVIILTNLFGKHGFCLINYLLSHFVFPCRTTFSAGNIP